MPEFDENTNFQLPGLGSAEKDSPGSFREGTPLFRVSGDPDPDEIIIEGVSGDSSTPTPQISQELTDLKESTARADVFNEAKKIFEAKEKQYNADLANRMRDAGGNNINNSRKLPPSVQGIANTAAREGAEGAGKGLGSRMLDALISSGKNLLRGAQTGRILDLIEGNKEESDNDPSTAFMQAMVDENMKKK